jgi:pyrimidine-nucleoside phosphorylase
MDDGEAADLTLSMAAAGDTADLSGVGGFTVDKHSTGGVGDKTTLIVSPIAAACHLKVAKMSGRGLGHTGGTVDKLEAIPGFEVFLPRERFLEIVKDVGLSVIGQTGNLAPADKKLYALRDVTGTVESIPLIASSIMSKKIAAGADAILLDVKVGSGAFMKDLESALHLAKLMVAVGKAAGKKCAALLTNMDEPLGCAVGNSLEVAESCGVLLGAGPPDLREISLALSSEMLFLGGLGDENQCREMAKDALDSGRAFQKLCEMVKAQGGNTQFLTCPEKFPRRPSLILSGRKRKVIFPHGREKIGISSMLLARAGRRRKAASTLRPGFSFGKIPALCEDRGSLRCFLRRPKENPRRGKYVPQRPLFSNEPPAKKPLLLGRVGKRRNFSDGKKKPVRCSAVFLYAGQVKRRHKVIAGRGAFLQIAVSTPFFNRYSARNAAPSRSAAGDSGEFPASPAGYTGS